VALDGKETATLVSSNKQPKHYKDWAIITAVWLESTFFKTVSLKKANGSMIHTSMQGNNITLNSCVSK